MKVLLVDNYDSFTFNLYQQIARVGGLEPIVVKNDEVSLDEIRGMAPDAIVLSPGPGSPDRQRDFGICRDILEQLQVPTLGVCLGHQGIGHYCGARVVPAPEPMHGRLSRVTHSQASLLQGIPSPFSVVRYHSLILASELSPELEALAQSEDAVVMALRHRNKPFWGVQFHPESVCCEYGDQIIYNFLALAGAPQATSQVPSALDSARPQPTSPNRVKYRKLDFLVDAEDAFVNLYARKPLAFWLGSHRLETGRSRFIYMGAADTPGCEVVYYHVHGRQLQVQRNGQVHRYRRGLYDYLNERLASLKECSPELPFEFNCGYAGYFGYELKAESGIVNRHVSPHPDAALIFAARLVVFDQEERCTYLVAHCDGEQESADAEQWFDETEDRLRYAGRVHPPRQIRMAPGGYRLEQPMARYLKDIDVCLERIREGESYEVCLTNRVLCPATPDTLDLYRTLSVLNPAPYACYLKFDDFAVLSSSPEQFLRVDSSGRVSSKPIKGTVARHCDPELDRRARELLGKNEKDFSENLMIVDLLRNDLGRVCEIGSVEVSKLMDVEQYTTVYQLVSTVEGQLRSDKSTIDCLHAAFPGGSMTGAPKLRTLEIIDELEQGPRGVYSGCAGFLGLGGGADLNILIRTIVACAEGMTIGTGGAIVGLSDPVSEFDEILLKARAPITAIELAKTGAFPVAMPAIQGAPGERCADITPLLLRSSAEVRFLPALAPSTAVETSRGYSL